MPIYGRALKITFKGRIFCTAALSLPVKYHYLITNPSNAFGSNHFYRPIGYEVPCGISGVNSTDSVRIVGGSNAKPAEFPWQVSLQRSIRSSSFHICGGAVISSYWILTAAHCVTDMPASALSVVAGDYDLYKKEGHEQRVNVVKVITQNYTKASFMNDIALLQVNPPLRLDGNWIAPICLPEAGAKFSVYLIVTGFATVTGWGRLSQIGGLPNILQKLTLPLVDDSVCRRWYTSAGYSKLPAGNCQLCSGLEKGGKDSCQGDSGGPLSCKRNDGRYYLCGIVSYGIGCARPKLPGIYTEVSCYTDWIKNNLYDKRQ
ncbi:hypothetical protein O3M35_003004 [Rhynocoris fuscipes]|uniref:Phenoloxidase-activating factor 2 n=1 Tax=Rhynocoris fuscipes TaxID=488301 RepID=A0AAW1CKY1_9HEMI